MYRPEGIFRKAVGSQSVLVGDHDKFEIQLLADEVQVSEHFRIELQFSKASN